MKIDLTDLLREIGEATDFEAEVKIDLTADGLKLTRPVNVRLQLINTGESVLVNGTFESEVELDCARCLKVFQRPVVAKVDEEFTRHLPPPPAKKGVEIELKEKDFVYPIEKDNTLDLDEIIRQNLVLALPISPLCEEECKGE